MIHRWRRELLDKGEGSFPGSGRPKQMPEEAEIACLKKPFKVSRSGFYGWLNGEASKRAVENQEIFREIRLRLTNTLWLKIANY